MVKFPGTPAGPTPDSETLPCGCVLGTRIENGVKTLFYKPCSELCEFYLYTLEESRKKGNRIEMRRTGGRDN